MANNHESWQLNQVDSEEITDVIVVLQHSFSLKFENDAFLQVNTFGDLCDVLEGHMIYEDKEGCTSQQAFYKLRKAIMETLGVAKEEISAGTRLESLFPRKHRSRLVNLLKQQMGVEMQLLTCKSWITNIAMEGMFFSFIMLFFYWEMGVAGMLFFFIASLLLDKTGWEFKKEVATVEQLVEVLVSEHYLKVRRHENTINRAEIVPLITKLFQQKLGINSANLTRSASLS